MPQHFDACIIGTGQAGPSLANRLTQAGMKVAVIERGRFGGTCVNTGCMPTKTLVASAYAARLAARAADYGVKIEGPVSIDMKTGQGAQGCRFVRCQPGRRGLAQINAGMHDLPGSWPASIATCHRDRGR